MDVVANWMHDIYKPVTDEQQKVVDAHGAELETYAAQISDHLFSRDSGDKPPDPPHPGCPDYVRASFGCI
jgi:hypothetical protein